MNQHRSVRMSKIMNADMLQFRFLCIVVKITLIGSLRYRGISAKQKFRRDSVFLFIGKVFFKLFCHYFGKLYLSVGCFCLRSGNDIFVLCFCCLSC